MDNGDIIWLIHMPPDNITPAPDPVESAPVAADPPVVDTSQPTPDLPATDSNTATSDTLVIDSPAQNLSQPATDSFVPPLAPIPVNVDHQPVAASGAVNSSAPVIINENPVFEPSQPDDAASEHARLVALGRSLLPKANATRAAHKQKHMDRIVALVGEQGTMLRQELILIMHMSAAQIDRYLHELVAEGKLRHIGAHNHGKYERV